MTPMTTAMPSAVAKPESSISQRTLAMNLAWAGSSGLSSTGGLTMGEMRETESSVETVVVADDQAGARLDRVLAMQLAALSRTRLKALVLAGRVAIGGRTIRDPRHPVNAGDTVIVQGPAAEPAAPRGGKNPPPLLPEGHNPILIHKPAGPR